MNKIGSFAIPVVSLILSGPVSGHHSDAGMDMESVIAFEGTVKEFVWRNLHVYVIVETQRSGEPMDWELQMGPINVITRRGWSPDALSPGDRVAVRANPMEDGRPYGILRSVEGEGFSLGAAGQAPEVSPPAASLEGR